MANAKFDANHVPSLTGVLNSTGTSIVQVVADPNAHTLNISDSTGGSDNGPSNAMHDQNHVPTGVAFSSADGTTPVVLYADSSGNLLVNSN